jgi:hypothetical protein
MRRTHPEVPAKVVSSIFSDAGLKACSTPASIAALKRRSSTGLQAIVMGLISA